MRKESANPDGDRRIRKVDAGNSALDLHDLPEQVRAGELVAKHVDELHFVYQGGFRDHVVFFRIYRSKTVRCPQIDSDNCHKLPP